MDKRSLKYRLNKKKAPAKPMLFSWKLCDFILKELQNNLLKGKKPCLQNSCAKVHTVELNLDDFQAVAAQAVKTATNLGKMARIIA